MITVDSIFSVGSDCWHDNCIIFGTILLKLGNKEVAYFEYEVHYVIIDNFIMFYN